MSNSARIFPCNCNIKEYWCSTVVCKVVCAGNGFCVPLGSVCSSITDCFVQDSEGAYYWHVKSGTIQREPPQQEDSQDQQDSLVIIHFTIYCETHG